DDRTRHHGDPEKRRSPRVLSGDNAAHRPRSGRLRARSRKPRRARRRSSGARVHDRWRAHEGPFAGGRMTARWRTREELIHQVVLLTTQGMSRRAVTRALGVSRNTIRKILRTHGKERDTGHSVLPTRPERVPRGAKIDAHRGRVDELLVRYPDITAQRVWEILRDEGFTGGYTGVKKHLRRVRPPPRPTPSLEAPVFGPGEMAESDWSPYEVTYTDGRSEILQLFAYVLVFSKRKFFDAFGSVDLFALMDGHERAFARFRGYAAACKYDSQKPVVLRWEGAQPIYNPRYPAFA